MTIPRKPLPPEVVKKIEALEELLREAALEELLREAALPPLDPWQAHLAGQLLSGPSNQLLGLPLRQSLPHVPPGNINFFPQSMYPDHLFLLPEVPTPTTSSKRPRLQDRLWSRIQQIRYFLFRLRHR